MSFLHIRGDTFSEQFQLENTGPIESVTSQIKTRSGVLVDQAEINQLDELLYEVKVQDTKDWPTGRLIMDLEIVFQDETIKSTPTISIIVKKDVTING